MLIVRAVVTVISDGEVIAGAGYEEHIVGSRFTGSLDDEKALGQSMMHRMSAEAAQAVSDQFGSIVDGIKIQNARAAAERSEAQARGESPQTDEHESGDA